MVLDRDCMVCPDFAWCKQEKELERQYDSQEMHILHDYLHEHEIRHCFRPMNHGTQIIVYDEDWDRVWDAICHASSYGRTKGLLEVYGYDICGHDDVDVLTAAEVIARLEAKKNA